MQQQTTQQERKSYGSLVEELGSLLNGVYVRDFKLKFLSVLKTLKDNYNTELTTKFLRDMITGTPRQKTRRLMYVLRLGDLSAKNGSIEPVIKPIKKWLVQCWVTEKTEYSRTNKTYIEYLKEDIKFNDNLVGLRSIGEQKKQILAFRDSNNKLLRNLKRITDKNSVVKSAFLIEKNLKIKRENIKVSRAFWSNGNKVFYKLKI